MNVVMSITMRRVYYQFIVITYAAALHLQTSFEKVVVAVDHAPPYGVVSEDGRVSGAIVDIMREMQRTLPMKLEYVACPFSRCLKMLEQNEVDVMGGLFVPASASKKCSLLLLRT